MRPLDAASRAVVGIVSTTTCAVLLAAPARSTPSENPPQPLAVQVGFSKVDITPPEPLPLGGYTERRGKIMDSGGQPLYCRTILLKQGPVKVAIVSAEMLTIPESLRREVASRVPSDLRLFLAATHTHCAPDSQMLNDRMTFAIPGIATYKRRWLKWYADRIASGVAEAASRLGKSQTMLSTRTQRADLNRNRRGGPEPDKIATRLRFVEGDLIHYTAHPTLLGPDWNKTDGDWPGEVASNGNTLVLNGPIGDVSPKSVGKTPHDQIAYFASHVMDRKPVDFPVGVPVGRLRFVEQPISLDPVTPHPGFAKSYQVPDALAQTVVRQFAPVEANVTAIGLGDIAIVGVPGEPTTQLGKEIVAAGKRMGFSTVLPVSHVDGWIGYILEPTDYDKGGYEATLSFHGRLTGRKVVSAATQALRRLTQHPGGATNR